MKSDVREMHGALVVGKGSPFGGVMSRRGRRRWRGSGGGREG